MPRIKIILLFLVPFLHTIFSIIPRCKIIPLNTPGNPVIIQITNDCHLRVKVVWMNSETFWVQANPLREQNPWVLTHYTVSCNLFHYSDFDWIAQYIQYSNIAVNLVFIINAAKRKSSEPKYKFGIEVPRNARHVLEIDNFSNTKF